MGCFGDREKGPPDQTQKWDFITLSDFRCTSTLTYFAYGWLWFMAMVAVAVYGLDTSTAINLLVYNKWSSEVQPALPLKYSRWLFAACIIFSWVLLFYEWMRAVRAIRSGGVANSYMDPLAVTLQSMRSRGFKRFLVFSDLTKSKKGVDYVALFTYFAFKGAIRVILAEGPRQVVNGMTLYAVLTADLIPNGSGSHSGIEQFFLNIEALAEHSKMQTVVYVSMLFTLIIWVISALSLISAGIFYLLFLWHYIPSSDGSLNKYCRRKIDKRLEKIVEHKVKAALEEEDRESRKAERKAELKRQKTGELALPFGPPSSRKPTLPVLDDSPPKSSNGDNLPDFPLVRKDTTTTVDTLPLYSSSPPKRNPSSQSMQRQPYPPGVRRPQMPSRSGTSAPGWSGDSYTSDAPLLANAGCAGADDQQPTLPHIPPAAVRRQDSQWSTAGRPGPAMTPGPQRPFTPGIRPNPAYTQIPDQPPPSSFMTPDPAGPPAFRNGPNGRPVPGAPTNSDMRFDPSGQPYGPPLRTGTSNSYRPPPPRGDLRYARDASGRPIMVPPLRPGTARPYAAGPAPFSTNEFAPGARSQPPFADPRSFSRPRMDRGLSQDNTRQPGDLPGQHNLSSFRDESYEMTSQPSHSFPVPTPPPQAVKPSGTYTPFKPLSHENSPQEQQHQENSEQFPNTQAPHNAESQPSSPAYKPFSKPSPDPPSTSPNPLSQPPSSSSTYQPFRSTSSPESHTESTSFGLIPPTPSPSTPSNNSLHPLAASASSSSRSVHLTGRPGTEGNYFGHVEPTDPRDTLRVSATPSINSRHTFEYSDIFDAYAPTPFDDEEEQGRGSESEDVGLAHPQAPVEAHEGALGGSTGAGGRRQG